jgi:hypothetical protein
MSGSHFIITGTSKGIGEQLAHMLLEKGNAVHGIARGTTGRLSSYPNYRHHVYNLSETSGLVSTARRRPESICLRRVLETSKRTGRTRWRSLLSTLVWWIRKCKEWPEGKMNRSLEWPRLSPMRLSQDSCYLQR